LSLPIVTMSPAPGNLPLGQVAGSDQRLPAGDPASCACATAKTPLSRHAGSSDTERTERYFFPMASTPYLLRRRPCRGRQPRNRAARPVLYCPRIARSCGRRLSGAVRDKGRRKRTHAGYKKAPGLAAGGACLIRQASAYRLTWRLSPGPLPWVGPVARMSPVETTFTQSEPLSL